jgi:hypothetical protein
MASEVRLQLILGLEADLHGEIEDVIWLVVQ